jgi:hypothetical protein
MKWARPIAVGPLSAATLTTAAGAVAVAGAAVVGVSAGVDVAGSDAVVTLPHAARANAARTAGTRRSFNFIKQNFL